MNFELNEDYRMLQDIVRRFVNEHLLPLEPTLLKREASTGDFTLTPEEEARLNEHAKVLGLWGLDAPEEMGGFNFPVTAMIGVNEELAKAAIPYHLPPDSPNLHMMLEAANDEQREKYLAPYARGETRSAIAISEPGAGSDPAALTTRAELQGDTWVLNGRKIWTSRVDTADWLVVMAVTDKAKGNKGGISAFIVDRDTPGFTVERQISMLGGVKTFELVFDDCRIPEKQLLGRLGYGFAPMQTRLSSRRIQIAAWSIGRAQRALDMLCEYAPQRHTFGRSLADRDNIQKWVADAATRIHASRLMAYDAASRVDQGQDARIQVSMVKAYATEMAWEVIDRVMQVFGGMGMTKELPLQQLANETRLARIYEGPTEIHEWVIARKLLGLKR